MDNEIKRLADAARESIGASEEQVAKGVDLHRELFSCDLPYCTPDGKPTLVQLSLAELGRKFGKK